MAELNDRQELFCQEYLVDYNATQAAIRAGYAEESAGVQACRLLKNDKVLSRVRALQAEQTERLCVTRDYVIYEILSIYKSAPSRYPCLIEMESNREFLLLIQEGLLMHLTSWGR